MRMVHLQPRRRFALFAVLVIFSSSLPLTALAANNSVSTDGQSLKNLYKQQVRSAQSNLMPENSAFIPTLKDTKNKAQNTISGSKNLNIKKLQPQQDYVEGEILVKYKNNKIDLTSSSGRTKSLNFISSKSLEKKEDLMKINTSVLRIKDSKTVEEKVAELKNDTNVEYVEPNYKRYPAVINTNDTFRGLLWGLDNTGQTVGGDYSVHTGANDKDIDAPEAWATNEGTNSSVIVVVIDSGVAYNHPDLANNMWDGSSCKDENGNSLGGCNHGYDYTNNDKTPLPTTSSHGTHVAGTIGAVKGNSRGIIGVAPNVKIMAIKFDSDVASEIKSIDFAIQNGGKIINASFGAASFSQLEFDAINRFKVAGGIFVAAAGNGGADGIGDNNDASHFYPSDYNLDNIISVAATDQNDALASFSDYGATSVDVGAPGTNIYSTIADSSIMSENFDSVSTPYLPSGWTKTENWGTYIFGGAIGNVLYGDYSHIPYVDNADSIAIAPTYNLGGNTRGATISFISRCDTEYTTTDWYDYMSLELSSDGTTFTELIKWDEATLDMLNGENPPNDAGGAAFYFDNLSIPSQYLTGNFKFRFKWHTDASNYPVQNYDGCFVDDINITKYSDGSDEKYDYMDGTSMATPHVVGEAALIWGYKPDLTYSQVKDTILNTGDSVTSLSGKTVSGRRINAFNALNSLAPVTHTISGTVKYYGLNTNGSEKKIAGATVILKNAVGTQLATTTTDTNGAYQFTGVPHGGNYVISVTKNDSFSTSGVTVIDLINIKKHTLGTVILDIIYKKIAADFDFDGAIKVTDLIKIKKFTLGTANPTADWKFYSSDVVLTEGNYLTNGLTRTYANLTTDMLNQNFTGIKMGDADMSWASN